MHLYKRRETRTYHDREDTLLHFTSILSAEDNHLHALKIDFNRGGGAHTLGETVGGELTSIVDDKVGLAKVFELLLGRANEHVVLRHVRNNMKSDWRPMAYHEKGMVSTSTDDSDLDAVFGIPLDRSTIRKIWNMKKEHARPHSHQRRKHCHGY